MYEKWLGELSDDHIQGDQLDLLLLALGVSYCCERQE